MKILAFVFLAALLVIVALTWSGYGGSTMDDYFNAQDGSQTLTVLENKTSMHTLVVGIFTKPQGYYLLRKSDAPATGRFTREQNTYTFTENSGKEWKRTIQPDSSLRDESGVTWTHKSHAESTSSVEQNRASCEEHQGKNCPF